MRGLRRNERTFYYAQYVGKTDIKDTEGNDTGEFKVEYSKPIRARGNISASTGVSETEMFGANVKYDKVIIIANPKFPMDEYSILFIEKPYEEDDEGNPLPDYVVKRVARSLNSVSYAISKVE